MCRSYFLSLVLFIYPLCAGAQNSLHELRGYLGVEGGESYTYKLVFRDSAGFLKGYAFTYLYENKEVKAAIVGKVNRSKRQISFRETEIVYNHGFESSTIICLIQAVLSYTTDANGRTTFSGPIVSNDAGNTYCGQGFLMFSDAAVPPGLWDTVSSTKPVRPSDPSPKHPVRYVYDTVKRPQQETSVTPVAPDKRMERLTTGSEKYMECESDTLILRIWDGSQVDGDRVSVYWDDEPVWRNGVLSKVPHTFRLPLQPDRTYILRVVAENEGNEPPNSADIALIDGGTVHRLLAYNNTGASVLIRIRKKRK